MQLDNQTVERILYTVKTEAAAGRAAESDQLLAQLARQAPHHPAVLNELGVRMMARGSAEQAHALFIRATTARPEAPHAVGQSCEQPEDLGPARRGK